MSVQSRQTPPWLIILLIVGGLCVLTSCIICPAVLFPVFSQAREAARRTACLSNLKELATAQQLYANDYEGRFPIASRWGDLTRPYVRELRSYHCPSVPQGQFGYAMNVHLSRQKMSALRNLAQIPLLYDSTNLAWNAHDPFTSLPNPPRHGQKGNNIAFADGHAKTVGSP